MALAQLARVLWALGYADQAQQRSQEALTQAQQSGHIASLVYAELYAAILAQYRRDVAAVQAHTDAVLALATAQGLGHRIEEGRLLRGWALAMQGDAAAGVAHIQQGLVAVHSMGLKLYQAYFLALLAEAYGQTGQPEHGLQVLAEAATLITTTEVRWWEPEVARLQGELLAQLSHPDESQIAACFHHALTVARAQQATALELRAAMSLSQLWQQQGKREEARTLLAPMYSWFTEGFDTADLQQAKALLAALKA